MLLVLVLWRPSVRRKRTTTLDTDQIFNGNLFIPRYFWPLFLCAAFLSYFVVTESGTELVINIDQEWAEFLLFLAAGLNLLRTYILLGNAQPRQTTEQMLITPGLRLGDLQARVTGADAQLA